MALTPVNTALSVDRETFILKLWKRRTLSWQFRIEAQYKVAVGAEGYETPTGLYLINSKVKNPDWRVPDSQWAVDLGLVPGTIVKGSDPANPIKARWMGVTNPNGGVGIHGTANDASIGSAASHGCIRMHVPDVIDLFGRVPKYAPIFII